MKSFFRCMVCNDIHYGSSAPKKCPTCGATNAYVPVEDNEARMIQFQQKTVEKQISVADQKSAWVAWTADKDFKMNPDTTHADTAIQGALESEATAGLKYCPCRLRYNDFERDLEFICPCNFKIQPTWKKKRMCWCGLFVKR